MPGDLLFFFDAIVHRFDNRVVRGTRHSMIAFALGNMLSWWTQECGWDDSRERERRAPRDKYRKVGKMLQKENKLMSESNLKKEKCGWRQAKAEWQSRIQFKISQVIVCICKRLSDSYIQTPILWDRMHCFLWAWRMQVTQYQVHNYQKSGLGR
jgi:hypothetical protein